MSARHEVHKSAGSRAVSHLRSECSASQLPPNATSTLRRRSGRNRTVNNLGSDSASGTSFQFRNSSNSGSCEGRGGSVELGVRPGQDGRMSLAWEAKVNVKGVRIQPAHKAGRNYSRGLVFKSFRPLNKSSTLVIPSAIFVSYKRAQKDSQVVKPEIDINHTEVTPQKDGLSLLKSGGLTISEVIDQVALRNSQLEMARASRGSQIQAFMGFWMRILQCCSWIFRGWSWVMRHINAILHTTTFDVEQGLSNTALWRNDLEIFEHLEVPELNHPQNP